jgi:hypothetical protein
MVSPTAAVLHSCIPCPTPLRQPTSFLEVSHSHGNGCDLWEDLVVDGDGEWLQQRLIAQTLVTALDGSFMPLDANDLCSAGIIIYCTSSKFTLRASAAERSNAASNYRGELLGAVMSMLILRAASSGIDPPYPKTRLYCDNRGVIIHGNSPCTALPEKQNQADLIRHLKYLTGTAKV